jgi:dihydroorotase-like cyclic amidohydrolase
MSVLIRGGTIVNTDQTFPADVLCRNGVIEAIGSLFQYGMSLKGEEVVSHIK